MADENLQGSIIVLMLYDIADEIRLTELPPLIGATTLAPSLKHPAPEYVRFERPPVIDPLAPVRLPSGEEFAVTVQYYDYGVASLLLRFPFTGSWARLDQLSADWISSPFFEEVTRKLLRQRVDKIASALIRPYQTWLSEDYYIFHVHSVPGLQNGTALLTSRGQEISQIIRGEATPLSEFERNEVLQGCMSYYPNDLIVAGWNGAFLFDTPSGAETAVRLLEYANSQLLQFRHYDEMLTRELEDVYRFVGHRRRGLLSGWRMRPAAGRLRAMLLEVTELTERTTNALKFVGDTFSARLYKLCAARIGVADYQLLVQEKLRTADELYDFMIEQFHQARGFILEFTVVLILVIELFFLFTGGKT